MTTATLKMHAINRNIRSKVGQIELPTINWKMIFVFGLLSVFMSLGFYIYGMINITQQNYLINSYKKDIDGLAKETRNLEVSFAQNSFLGEVVQKTQALNFEKTTQVKYIQILEASLASAGHNNVR